MKELGIWYFNTGWMLSCIAGIVAGGLWGENRRLSLILMAAILAVGLFMFYAKYA